MCADAATGRVFLPSVDSTNAEGFRRAGEVGEGAPLWVMAREQTAGRGRRSRPWVSPPGNFYGTLVMRPGGTPADAALRSFIAALALRDAFVQMTGLPDSFALKWPNDVLLNGGKVTGILLEAQGPVLCIGIGVNLIGAPLTDVIEQGAVTPVSLLDETGLRITPEAFLEALAPAFAARETQFATYGFAPLRRDWLTHAARLGEVIRARTGAETREGVFETVDEAGNLILRMPGGTIAIPAADVFF